MHGLLLLVHAILRKQYPCLALQPSCVMLSLLQRLLAYPGFWLSLLLLLLCQAAAADLEHRLLSAHEAIAKHLLDLGEAEGLLAHTRTKAATLEKR